MGLLSGVSNSENVEYHSPLERFKNRGAFRSREQCLCELNVVAGPAGREACMEPSVHLFALPPLGPSRGFWSIAENLLTQVPCQAWRAESRTQYQWKRKVCQGHSPKRASPCAYSCLPEVLPGVGSGLTMQPGLLLLFIFVWLIGELALSFLDIVCIIQG